MKNYILCYTFSRTNAKLHLGSTSGPCVYYMESATMAITNPQIMLRAGDSKTSPMVAFARLQTTSRHVLIGSGDHQRDPAERLVWEELHREKNFLRCSDYVFGTPVGSGHRRTYRWRKDKNKFAKNVYKCVDDEGEVVANMLSGGMFNWKKGGEIGIAEGLERGLEELLIVSALAIWTVEALLGQAVLQGY